MNENEWLIESIKQIILELNKVSTELKEIKELLKNKISNEKESITVNKKTGFLKD